MRFFFSLAWSIAVVLGSRKVVTAQDLAPRAYVITALHSNAVTLTWSFFDGSITYNGALPVSGATGTYSLPTFSYYHSFGFTTVRLNVEENQLVNVFGEFGICLGGLKSA
jgi:hypothetical protein